MGHLPLLIPEENQEIWQTKEDSRPSTLLKSTALLKRVSSYCLCCSLFLFFLFHFYCYFSLNFPFLVAPPPLFFFDQPQFPRFNFCYTISLQSWWNRPALAMYSPRKFLYVYIFFLSLLTFDHTSLEFRLLINNYTKKKNTIWV